MKKYLSILIVLISLLFGLNFALAADSSGISSIGSKTEEVLNKAGYEELSPAPEVQITVFIGVFLRYFLAFLGVIFLFLTIYAGFLWMSAQGNEEQVNKAIKILKTGIVGMVLIFASYIIYQTILLLFV